MPKDKIRIAPQSVRLLEELNELVVTCNIRGPVPRFKDIASDCFDGAYTSADLNDLIKRRLLTVVNHGFDDSEKWGRDPRRLMDPRQCGTSWSVDPTERLLRALWPDRIEPEAA